MTTDNPSDLYTSALIAAAEEHATAYDEDDRAGIETDVMNAFYAGAAWAVQCEHSESRNKIRELEQELFFSQCRVADLERDL